MVMCIILNILNMNVSAQAAEAPVKFKKTTLHEQYIAEGINYADFNRDGNRDIVSGPYWHEGPDFLTRHEYYPFQPVNIETGAPLDKWDPTWSSTNWAFYVYDFNRDGWPDVLRISYPGREAYWYQNPQVHNGEFWPAHLIFPVVDIEGVTFDDIKKGLYVFHQVGGNSSISYKATDALNQEKVIFPSIFFRGTHSIPSGSKNQSSSATVRSLDGRKIITIPDFMPVVQY
jgi:hypothetical protein